MNPEGSHITKKAVESGQPWLFRPQYRILIVLFIFGMGVAVSLYFFTIARTYEQDKGMLVFKDKSRKYIDAFQDYLQHHQHDLDALRAFFLGSQKVERHEFAEYVNHLLFHNPAIQALEWIPHVPADMRDEFEQQARAEGHPDFEFTEQAAQGYMTRAGQRDEYFPVYYIEPLEGNERAIGFDLNSDKSRQQALEKARDTGIPTATERITLVQEKEDQFGFLLFHSVYKPEMPSKTALDHRRYLKGFVLGVYRIGDIFENAIAQFDPSGIDFYLFDESAPEGSSFLYVHSSRTRTEPVAPAITKAELRKGYHYSGTIDVGGRKWLVIAKHAPGFFALQKSGMPWIALTAGILLSAIMGGIIMLILDHSAATRLHSDELEKEILERRNIERKLSGLVKRLEVIVQIEKAIVGAETLEEIAKIVTEGIEQIILCDRSSVVKFDFTKNTARVLAVTTHAETQIAADYECSLDEYGISEGLWNGEMKIQNNLTTDGEDISAIDRMLHDEGIRSYINMPLMHDGGLVGALNVGANRPEAMSDNDIDVVRDVASLLAIAIKNKEIEKHLLESEQKFRSIYDSALDGILVAHIKTRNFISGNATICTMLGYSPDELLRLGVQDIHPEENLPHVIEQFEKQAQGKFSIAENIPVKRKDGSIFYADISASTVTLEEEEYQVGIFRDISARKEAEEALRSERDRAQRYLDVAGVMLLAIGPDEKVKLINRRGCEILACDEKGVVGANWFDTFIPEEGRQEIRDGFNKIIAGNMEQWEYHINPVITRTGKKKIIAWHNSLLKNADGQVVATLSSGEDITERRKLEEQLHQAAKMEAIGHLAGGIAHDFNNILTAIIGYGNLLRMKITEKPLQTYVEHIISSSENAARLVQNLLAFSRKQGINAQPVDLNEIVKRIEALLRRVIGEDIELRTDLAKEEVRILADAGQIEQVIMNMAANARDAMPEGGRLFLKTAVADVEEDFVASHAFAKTGMYGVLTIEDTGSGIDKDVQTRIYEPFFTTKEVGKGTGLGLSIVYGIIEQHEGFIHVLSQLGQGTAFKIYIPVSRRTAEPVFDNKRELEEIETTTPSTETVLLAEDDDRVRKLIKDILEHRGYHIIEAEDGEIAIEKFRENQAQVALLLLDVIMPKKNGKDVYDEINRMKPGIKAIFLSGYTADIIQKKGIIDSGLGFIMKPVSIKNLLDKVRAVLDS